MHLTAEKLQALTATARTWEKGNLLPHPYLLGVHYQAAQLMCGSPSAFPSHTALRTSSGMKRDISGLSVEIPG